MTVTPGTGRLCSAADTPTSQHLTRQTRHHGSVVVPVVTQVLIVLLYYLVTVITLEWVGPR